MAVSIYKRKRNTDISTLIRNFENKESGKVAVSRPEIKRRFDYLDWKHQKKIITLFLAGIASDRDWAYKKLLSDCNWDDSFVPILSELWEMYYEDVCSWIIIKYLPEEYVMSHLSELDSKNNYPFLCRRLWKRDDFSVERDRMSAYDYFLFLRKTGQKIETDEGIELFFQAVHEGCINDANDLRFTKMPNGFFELHSPKDFANNNVSRREFCFRNAEKLLNTLPIYLDFTDWENLDEWVYEVNKQIVENPEFQKICREPQSQQVFATKAANIALETFYKALDDKYKSPQDPPIESLILPVQSTE